MPLPRHSMVLASSWEPQAMAQVFPDLCCNVALSTTAPLMADTIAIVLELVRDSELPVPTSILDPTLLLNY